MRLREAVKVKVIFLDIDGVLNSEQTENSRELPYIVDEKLLKMLRELLDRTSAKVVLTSSWRIDPIGLYAAKYWGIPHYGVCPDLPGRSRKDEILIWLGEHPTVTRYAVIDDEDDELDDLPLFQPSGKYGLTSEIVRGVERFLNEETDETMRSGWLKQLVQKLGAPFKRRKD
jgi:hypothetical protein